MKNQKAADKAAQSDEFTALVAGDVAAEEQEAAELSSGVRRHIS